VADEMARDDIPAIAYQNTMKYAIGL